MQVARGLVLVRPADTSETLGGGKIIIPQDARAKLAAYQCEVIDVGPPEICEDEDCERPHEMPINRGMVPLYEDASWERQHIIPPALCAGAWVLVKPRSFIAASELEHHYFVRQDQVEAVFTVTPD